MPGLDGLDDGLIQDGGVEVAHEIDEVPEWARDALGLVWGGGVVGGEWGHPVLAPPRHPRDRGGGRWRLPLNDGRGWRGGFEGVARWEEAPTEPFELAAVAARRPEDVAYRVAFADEVGMFPPD